MRAGIRAATSALCCLIIFYVAPTAVEIKLAAALGPVVYVILGDVLGSAFLAALDLRAAIGLYAVLTNFEILLLRSGVRPMLLAFLTDLVPALVLAALAAAATMSAEVIREIDSRSERLLQE